MSEYLDDIYAEDEICEGCFIIDKKPYVDGKWYCPECGALYRDGVEVDDFDLDD